MGVCDAAVWYSFARDKSAVAWQTAEPLTGGCVAGSPVGGGARPVLAAPGFPVTLLLRTSAKDVCHVRVGIASPACEGQLLRISIW